MWDKLDLEIPFDDLFVKEVQSTSGGFVDFKEYDFKGIAMVSYDEHGQPTYEDEKAMKWDKLSTQISKLAVGFFPDGNGFNHWPHIRVKASPAKIIQGHNVFGSEDIRPGLMQMLLLLSQAFPKIYRHLNIQQARVCYLDATYSGRCESQFYSDQLFRLFEATATTSRSKLNKEEDYLKLGCGSEYFSQKLYRKHQELMSDLQDACRKRERDRIAVLSDRRLHDWALGMDRFEGTIGHRAMERHGIPRRLPEFLKFHDWFLRVHKEPLCRHVWREAFKKIFSDLEGHTMKRVDDHAIKLKIDAKFIKIKDNGKICRRKANAIYNTYGRIRQVGYATLAKERNKTFFRNVGHLQEIGLSKAFLKSLDPHKPLENVVSIVKLVNIDFANQRPDWYQEPQPSADDPRLQLRLVS